MRQNFLEGNFSGENCPGEFSNEEFSGGNFPRAVQRKRCGYNCKSDANFNKTYIEDDTHSFIAVN